MEIYLPSSPRFSQAKIIQTIPHSSTWHHVIPCCVKIERQSHSPTRPIPNLKNILEVIAPSWQSVLVGVCNAMDDFINTTLDTLLRPAIDPKHILAGNFSPVDEIPPMECEEVEGVIPSCLEGGIYIHNGPKPNFPPLASYNLLDGNGMIHALAFHKRVTTLSSRYVRTHKYLEEIFPNVFSGFRGYAGIARVAMSVLRVALGFIDPGKGVGVVNTSVFFFHNKLLALGELGLPHVLHITSDGDIHTSGAFDFGGKLFALTTVHPKIDSRTGELFA